MCKLPDIHRAPGQYSGSKVVTCNKIMSGLGSNDKKQPLENMIHLQWLGWYFYVQKGAIIYKQQFRWIK